MEYREVGAPHCARVPEDEVETGEDPVKNNTVCTWEDEGDGYYNPGCCSDAFMFNEGTATENGFKFCPFCGKPLEDLPYKDCED